MNEIKVWIIDGNIVWQEDLNLPLQLEGETLMVSSWHAGYLYDFGLKSETSRDGYWMILK